MQIKREPKDFIVEEIPSRTWNSQGKYWVYKVTCTDVTTHIMTVRLASVNSMSSRDIRYAGTKDRRAITTQYITSPKQLHSVDEDIVLEHVGFTNEHLRLGELQANKFIITVYDVTKTHDVHIPNYFGDQRFSTENVDIGLALMNGDFMHVAESLRDQYQEIDEHLQQHPTDAIGSLRKAPKLSLIMYVHSVQSWLFNEAVSAYVKDSFEYVESEYRHGTLCYPTTQLPATKVPIVGATQELGEWQKYYAPLFRKHKISPSQFYIRSLPYLTQEGELRDLRSQVKNVDVQLKESTATVSMTLGSGCYATVVLSGLLS